MVYDLTQLGSILANLICPIPGKFPEVIHGGQFLPTPGPAEVQISDLQPNYRYSGSGIPARFCGSVRGNAGVFGALRTAFFDHCEK